MIRTGPDFAYETLVKEDARARALIGLATRYVPKSALRLADAVSRRWLDKWDHELLEEIDRIAQHIAMPGAYYLSVSFEWGCTVMAGPGGDGRGPRLVRVLDWFTHGLGRYVIAAEVKGAAGPFVALTWPGYTGVLHAMAPNRFAGALNQAPMRRVGGGIYPFDWVAGRVRVWRTPHIPPAHLLRRVFETARDYGEAKRLLVETPIAIPAIFTLTGLVDGESCVIERLEDDAVVIEGAVTAANHWQGGAWRGRARGIDSIGRGRQMAAVSLPDFDDEFAWLAFPVRNRLTRLAMIADAARGRVMAQGYEVDGAATEILDWTCADIQECSGAVGPPPET